jgi:hypothetical protein
MMKKQTIRQGDEWYTIRDVIQLSGGDNMDVITITASVANGERDVFLLTMTFIEGVGVVTNKVETFTRSTVQALQAALVERDQTEADAMERYMND